MRPHIAVMRRRMGKAKYGRRVVVGRCSDDSVTVSHSNFATMGIGDTDVRELFELRFDARESLIVIAYDRTVAEELAIALLSRTEPDACEDLLRRAARRRNAIRTIEALNEGRKP